MPTDKDFKRLVRARMQKTGESYTTARAQLLRTKPGSKPAAIPAASYAAIAGRSDAIMKQRTGCTWERWVKALDRVGASEWPHSRIARYVSEKYKTPSWWSQTVTVGYERIKGLRVLGQRRDGSFEANKSKTFAVSLARLYRAWSHAPTRARWAGLPLTVRFAARDKYMRIVWPDGTPVLVGFLGKGPGKSQVAVQHGKLPDKATATRMKAEWGQRLSALGEVLSPSSK